MTRNEFSAQIRSHLETITHAASQANELSAKLQLAQSEGERLRAELGSVTEIKQKLEERRKYLENKVQLLKTQIEETQGRFSDIDRIKGLIEEQLRGEFCSLGDREHENDGGSLELIPRSENSVS